MVVAVIDVRFGVCLQAGLKIGKCLGLVDSESFGLAVQFEGNAGLSFYTKVAVE